MNSNIAPRPGKRLTLDPSPACWLTSDLAGTSFSFSCILLRTSQRGPASDTIQRWFHQEKLFGNTCPDSRWRSRSSAASTLSTTSVLLSTAIFSRFLRLPERGGVTNVSPSVPRCRIPLSIICFCPLLSYPVIHLPLCGPLPAGLRSPV